MTEALPVSSPISGVLWTWILPIALFAVAAVATWMLYRHFSNQKDDDK